MPKLILEDASKADRVPDNMRTGVAIYLHGQDVLGKMVEWCMDHIGYVPDISLVQGSALINVGLRFFFKKESEAVLFKTRWG